MGKLEVGPHDPIVLSGMGGVWVECECGWISPSFFSVAGAENSHERHVARAASLSSEVKA